MTLPPLSAIKVSYTVLELDGEVFKNTLPYLPSMVIPAPFFELSNFASFPLEFKPALTLSLQ